MIPASDLDMIRNRTKQILKSIDGKSISEGDLVPSCFIGPDLCYDCRYFIMNKQIRYIHPDKSTYRSKSYFLVEVEEGLCIANWRYPYYYDGKFNADPPGIFYCLSTRQDQIYFYRKFSPAKIAAILLDQYRDLNRKLRANLDEMRKMATLGKEAIA